MSAITAADREIYQRKQKIEEEKWKVVADFLKASRPTTNYSQNACRDRFHALENGTATIPPELADHPDERRGRPAAVTKPSPVQPANAHHGPNGVSTDLRGGAGGTDRTNAPGPNGAREFVATLMDRGSSVSAQASTQIPKGSNIARPAHKTTASSKKNSPLLVQNGSSEGSADRAGTESSSSD